MFSCNSVLIKQKKKKMEPFPPKIPLNAKSFKLKIEKTKLLAKLLCECLWLLLFIYCYLLYIIYRGLNFTKIQKQQPQHHEFTTQIHTVNAGWSTQNITLGKKKKKKA